MEIWGPELGEVHLGPQTTIEAVVRLNAERCMEVLWVPGHCGPQGNILADEEATFGLAEHQPPVQLNCANRRAIIGRACSTPFITTSLHTVTYLAIRNHRENILLFKPDMTHLRSFRSGYHPALRRW